MPLIAETIQDRVTNQEVVDTRRNRVCFYDLEVQWAQFLLGTHQRMLVPFDLALPNSADNPRRRGMLLGNHTCSQSERVLPPKVLFETHYLT